MPAKRVQVHEDGSVSYLPTPEEYAALKAASHASGKSWDKTLKKIFNEGIRMQEALGFWDALNEDFQVIAQGNGPDGGQQTLFFRKGHFTLHVEDYKAAKRFSCRNI